MHRKQACPSKILAKKWDEKLMEIHHRKLDEMRPLHNNKSPAYFSHIISKPKHHQLLEGKPPSEMNEPLFIWTCY